MGFGASSNRDTKNIKKASTDNDKAFNSNPTSYYLKKINQLAAFLDNLELDEELNEECKEFLVKDNEGFTTSADGEEHIVLQELIEKVLNSTFNKKELCKFGIDFIKCINGNINEIEKRFGRYECNSSRYLIKKITTMTFVTLYNNHEQFNFLFSILGTFRYSAVCMLIILSRDSTLGDLPM